MRIAVDLDGVLYEWQRTYRYMMREYRGVKLPPIEEFWHNWNSAVDRVGPENDAWMWDRGVKLGLFRHGHVTTGGIIGLTDLKRQGHELVVATHRPAIAIRDTINWLDHHFGALDPYPWSGMHILTEGEPKTEVKADLLIDDKRENILDWHLDGRQAIVFDRPWNQNVEPGSGIWRAHGWSSVVNIVNQIDYHMEVFE